MSKHIFVFLRELLNNVSAQNISQDIDDINHVISHTLRDLISKFSQSPAPIVANENSLIVIFLTQIVINNSDSQFTFQ